MTPVVVTVTPTTACMEPPPVIVIWHVPTPTGVTLYTAEPPELLVALTVTMPEQVSTSL
jgi:hypothetical protein